MTQSKHKEAEQLLKRTKISFLNKDANIAFFAHICYGLKTIFTDEIPTGATDGKRILLNPSFFLGLNNQERIGLLVHETMHVVLLHILRKKERNPYIWNMAADYVINNFLVKHHISLPKDALINSDYDDMTTEEVYKLLIEENTEEQDYTFQGDILPADDDFDKDEMVETLERAKGLNKGISPGNVLGDLQRIFDERKPTLPWNILLYRYMSSTAKAGQSWSRPNRRFKHVYLPIQKTNALENITVAIDTSGSVSSEMFNQFMSEFINIFKQVYVDKITLIQFDHNIQAVDTLASVNDINNVKLVGGGGTELTPVLEYYNESPSRVLVVITDGYFNQSYLETNKEVLWLIYDNSNFESEIGHTIHIEVND